jgi:predicted nucleic acid-binding protein
VTVVDTSVVVDFLLGTGVARDVLAVMEREAQLAAPDLLAFEVVAVLRRHALRHGLDERRAEAAVADLGDLPIELFPGLSLRHRSWELRHNLTTADAMFVALAEQLGEPLMTKDSALATAAAEHADVDVVLLTVP